MPTLALYLWGFMVKFKTPMVELPDTTIKDLTQMIDDLEELKSQHERLKKIATEKWGEHEKQRLKILAVLQKNDIHDFKGSNKKVYISTDSSPKFPQSLEDKKSLFRYIIDKYSSVTLQGLLSINSQKFKAFYNKEKDLAPKTEEFCMPGVGQVSQRITLNMRKK